MDAPESEKRDCCPVCGQVLPPDAEYCPACRFARAAETASDDPNAINPYAPPAPEESRVPFQFSLWALLIFTTYVAVLLSIGLMVPGLGIFLAILLTPALLRTYFRTVQAMARGEPPSGVEKLHFFVTGMGIAVVIGLAWVVALAVMCFAALSAGSRGGSGPIIVFAAGGIGGLVVSLLALWEYCIRPVKKRQRRTGAVRPRDQGETASDSGIQNPKSQI